MKTLTSTFTLLLLLSTFLHSQQNYTVHFTIGDQQFPENVYDFVQNGQIAEDESVEDHFYRFIQFYNIPNEAILYRIKQADISLLEYIPNNTYLAALPHRISPQVLQDLGVRSIVQVDSDLKLSSDLKNAHYPDWARQRGAIQLMVKYHKNLSQDQVKRYCLVDRITVMKSNDTNNFLQVSVAEQDIRSLVNLPYIAYAELIPPPSTPDDERGRAYHRSHAIDTNIDGGRKYDGSGVSVLTRDDGRVGPHIDYTGRINQDFVNSNSGTHGDGVSGIFCGAGNLDPTKKGMAAGATLFVTDYEPTFLDETMMLFNDYDVLVTNSSFSNGCNAGYTTITETVDQQIYENPTLLHVFSAGNSNNNDCGYGAGNQWGNITGGHKQGKNVIATANVFSNENLVGSSSRGPAHDGRIKPDIAAWGQGHPSTAPNNGYLNFGGTSGASPGIAGVVAQLHDAYRQHNNGETAESGLLKAILLNTAKDLGNKGPDFKFGWGRVNAFNAAKMIEEERYVKQTVAQGQTNNFNISVPDDVIELKVMTYWMDPEASTSANIALVNNINTTISSPNGTTHRPFRLNASPNPNSLDLPAGRGTDNLNNMEQILIENPAEGNYNLSVKGQTLPFGDHDYYIVWEYRKKEIVVTYPIGGEHWVPGETQRVYWEAEEDNNNSDFLLQISYNNGNNWTTLSVPDTDDRYADITVPNNTTGNAIIRVRRPGEEEGRSETTFSIMAVPQNLQVTKVCPEFTILSWDEMNIAETYDVYQLGEKYMEKIGSTSDNFFQIDNTNPLIENWYAVSANAANGAQGRRSIAIQHEGGLLDCELDNNIALLNIEAPAFQSAVSCDASLERKVQARFINNGNNTYSNLTINYQLDDEPIVTEQITQNIAVGQSINYEFNQGILLDESKEYELKIWSSLSNDQLPFDDTLSTRFEVQLVESEIPDIVENFENNFPPFGWRFTNPDNDITWDQRTVIGKDDTETNTIMMDFYFYPEAGQEDSFISQPLDFTNIPDDLLLCFDIAYTNYPNFFDTLKIEVYTDCGDTFFKEIYKKGGVDLQTVPTLDSPFVPGSADDWRVDSVSLNEFIGLNDLTIRFVGITDYGNGLYLDNINIKNYQLPLPTAAMNVSNDTPCLNELIDLADVSVGNVTNWAWNFGQDATPSSANSAGPHQISYASSGQKEVQLIVTNFYGTDTLTRMIEVEEAPIGDFEWVNIGTGEVTFSANSDNANTYSWTFENGANSDSIDPSFSYTEEGDYVVSLTMTNDCGETTINQTISVIATIPQPSANASVSNDAPCENENITLQDISTGTVDNWQWDFGENATPANSNEAGPHQISYETSGTKEVRLIVNNFAGADTFYQSITVRTVPTGNFNWQNIGTGEVIFTEAIGNANTYLWDFGDGNTSNEPNPSHVYANEGNYNISLLLVNDCGETQLSEVITVEATIPQPVANASISNDNPCDNEAITLQDVSSGTVASWQWDFGENAIPANSIEAGPHQVYYETGGSKEIRLIVDNFAGADTFYQNITVRTAPIGNFDWQNIGTGEVVFTNAVSNANSFSWDFGDGNTSMEASPNHTYDTEGDYMVSLLVINDCGETSINQMVTVNATIPAPIANASTSNQSPCTATTITLEDTSLGTIESWQWDFGENAVPANSNEAGPHQVYYETGGQKEVRLIVENFAGADTFYQNITVQTIPIGDFNWQNIGTGEVTFSNNIPNGVDFNWNFGDGNTSTEANPSHIYENEGNYTINLTVNNECGDNQFSEEVAVMATIPTPTAAANISDDTPCQDSLVTISDISTGTVENWEWDFGENAMPANSTEAGPHQVAYETGGIKEVRLIVENFAGADTFYQTLNVRIAPTGSFTASDNSLGEVTFTSDVQNATSFFWDFGNGATSELPNPTQIFTMEGSYTVNLTISNDCGETSIQETVVIEEIITAPNASMFISNVLPCVEESIEFQDNSSEAILTWSWDFGSGATPATADEAGPHDIVYGTAGEKTVQLIVTNLAGADTLTQILTVEAFPAGSFTWTADDLGMLNFNSTTTDTNTYTWDFGDGNGSTDPNPVHIYESDGTYSVVLTISNDCGEVQIEEMVDVIISSTQQFSENTQILIAPNPNQGIFNIQIEQVQPQDLTIQLINLEGKVIREKVADKMRSQQITFREQDLPAGLYFLRLWDGSSTKTYKLVIE